jgi:hypothetical protein
MMELTSIPVPHSADDCKGKKAKLISLQEAEARLQRAIKEDSEEEESEEDEEGYSMGKKTGGIDDDDINSIGPAPIHPAERTPRQQHPTYSDPFSSMDLDGNVD